MAEIEWTEEAKHWLQQIYDYIARDNEGAARRLFSASLTASKSCANSLNLGIATKSISTNNIRILLYGHYRVAYLIRDENTIRILGVLHGALDIDEHLKRIL